MAGSCHVRCRNAPAFVGYPDAFRRTVDTGVAGHPGDRTRADPDPQPDQCDRSGPDPGELLLVRHRADATPRFVAQVHKPAAGCPGSWCCSGRRVLAARIASALQTAAGRSTCSPGANGASVLLLDGRGVGRRCAPGDQHDRPHGILAPLAPDPNLMGITYPDELGRRVSSSPFSGMHLAMQGRFGIDSRGFLRWAGASRCGCW